MTHPKTSTDIREPDPYNRLEQDRQYGDGEESEIYYDE